MKMKWYEKKALSCSPHLRVDVEGEPYLERWHIIPQNPFFNIYLHRFTNSDLPVLHDHPWFSLSFILKGSFVEHRQDELPRHCLQRCLYFRSPFSRHYLEMVGKVSWTIFITGPVIKPWGFIENGKWIYNKTFLKRREERAEGKI